MSFKHDYQVKLLLVGDSGVGKTSMLLRFSDNSYQERFVSTIGVDFRCKNIHHEGKNVRLQIWDTAGQDKFQSITSGYYRGAEGVLLVFDITRPLTFERIRYWREQVKDKILREVPILLVGNKVDLSVEREISYKDAEELAESMGISYMECSSKMNEGIDEVFVELIDKIKPKKVESLRVDKDIFYKPPFYRRCC